MEHGEEALRRAARSTGISLTQDQVDTLAAYGEWLIAEAIPAGGLGPEETNRVVDRHLADSLVFARWETQPTTLIDVGTGVGLPGIPLAIAHPDIAVTLLDRSQRRAELARRAVQILRLECAVVQETSESHRATYAAATFRASLRPAQAMAVAERLLEPGGVAIIGLNRGNAPVAVPQSVSVGDVEVLETPEGILDSPAWHLRMTLR